MHSLLRHVRTVSTRVRPKRTSIFVDTLSQETNEPLWHVLMAIRQSDFKAAKALVPDYERWRPLTRAHGLARALNKMKGESGPLWLALYLLAYGVRAHDDAYPAGLDLAYAHLPSAPKHLHGPLLIFAVSSLSRFNLLLPIRRVIDTFLTTDLAPHSELYFNLFLQALTIMPTQCTETAQAIVRLLQRMEARKLTLAKETYDLLLNDENVLIHLAHFLRYHMTRHGATPTTAQLEAYLRIFAKKGSAEEAAEIYSALEKRVTPPTDTLHEDARLFVVHPNQPEPSLNQATKLLLSARANPTAATEYLRKLLNPRFAIPKTKTFSLKDLDLRKHTLTTIRRDPTPDIFGYTAALSSLAADQDASGAVLAGYFEKIRARRDIEPNEVTYTVLLRGLYDRGEKSLAMKYLKEYYNSGLPVDRKSLGVSLRVLTITKRPHVAFKLLQQWAYRLNLSNRELETVESENEDTPSKNKITTNSTAQKETKTDSRSFYRVSLSIITFNDWLVTLNRISRPDIVLAVWDALRPLYNVTPDARTLTILLAASRRALRRDGSSLKGVLVHMKHDIRETFGVHHPRSPQEEISIDDAQHNLETLLGPPNVDKPNPYQPKLWHGRLPADHARLLFLQAMFGAAPDPKALMNVEPPARAARKMAPSEEGEDVWGGLNVGLPKWREEGVDTWEPPEWEELLRKRKRVVSRPKESEEVTPIWLEEEDRVDGNVDRVGEADEVAEDIDEVKEDEEWQWDSYHPSIIPTNETFLHYILLLGLTGRASEIARVLAWMRHLKIVPHRSTLAVSLVFWREISGRAVLVERWTRRQKSSPSTSTEEADEPPWMRGPLADDARSALELVKEEERERAMMLHDAPEQYERLLTWLHEWVPKHMMPGPRSLARWTMNVELLRNGNTIYEAEDAIRETERREEEVSMRVFGSPSFTDI
ncbi:hypothetical protein C0995_010514 [Termitomyces sp. Mi166|nr:hypothetical protein C0995_010514 [Termitomyces sp. Mi166\